jgi:hypothetical protein
MEKLDYDPLIVELFNFIPFANIAERIQRTTNRECDEGANPLVLVGPVLQSMTRTKEMFHRSDNIYVQS